MKTLSKAKISYKLLLPLMTLSLIGASCSSSDVESTSQDVAASVATAEAYSEIDDAIAIEEAMAGEAAGLADTRASLLGDEDTEKALVPDNSENPEDPTSETADNSAAANRQIIYTANLTVEVEDVSKSEADSIKAVKDLGGFVFSQNSTTDYPAGQSGFNDFDVEDEEVAFGNGYYAPSEIVFKIAPNRFDAALDALAEVGEVRNRSVTADDVTEQVVDLETRIEVAEIGVDRLKESLKSTSNLQDFAEIERLLLQRETDLELMRGSLRTLETRVQLSTITLRLQEDDVQNSLSLRVTAYDDHDGGESCPAQNSSIFVDSGQDVTVCFQIVNNGDQTLTQVTLTDPSLGIEEDTQLTAVYGSLEEIAPGQEALMAYEFNPERPQTAKTRVKATPTNGIDDEPTAPSVTGRYTYKVNMEEPPHRSGFGDGFDVGRDFLVGLWSVLKVLAGFILPLLVVIIPLVLLARFLKKRLGNKMASRKKSRMEKRIAKANSQSGFAGAPAPSGNPETLPPPPEHVSEEQDKS